MGAYKSLTVQDVILSPFEVNKGFSFTGAAALTGSNVLIDRFFGKNITGSFDPGTDPITGQVSTGSYQRLIYSSVKHLYYSNFLSSSLGDNASTSSIVYGLDSTGDVRIGGVDNTNNYNYLQTTLSQSRYFPTASNSTIGVIAIPQNLFGDQIKPGSFYYSHPSGSIIDDGEGNILLTPVNEPVGNIIYQHGLIILTSSGSKTTGANLYGVGVYGTASYGGDTGIDMLSIFVTSSNVTCSFSSSYTIYETLFKCTLRENEFNFTQNPSAIEDQTIGKMYDYTTGSYFAPYITTIGLYNKDRELLAVGKLSQPLPSSRTTDMTIYVKIDK
jgi:hypothetical protein